MNINGVINIMESIDKLYCRTRNYFRDLKRQGTELLWAKKWEDTKRGIKWIENLPGISPCGAAVGYNYLYIMTRILNEMEPKNVLDIGLGISSTLISQYFKYMNSEAGRHIIIEHDQEWINFYNKKHHVSDYSTIILKKCVKKRYLDCEYNAYKDFSDKLKGIKFSIISIDGPIGWDKPYKHSRRDILDILPEALEDSFVIIMDDYNRKGEKATIAEIEEVLKKNKIEYFKGIYPGMTDCCVLTSADNKFFCTM